MRNGRFVRGVLLLVLLLSSARAFALSAEDCTALASGDYDARIAALGQVVLSGDTSAQAFLQAMLDDNVKIAGSKTFVIGADGKASDPVTGAAVELPRSALERVGGQVTLRDDPMASSGKAVQLKGPAPAQVRGKTVLRVKGTAAADALKEARIEIGAGDNPGRWTKVSRTISKPVSDGVLDELPIDALRSSKQWTVRVIVVNRNGRQREARFKLTLG